MYFNTSSFQNKRITVCKLTAIVMLAISLTACGFNQEEDSGDLGQSSAQEVVVIDEPLGPIEIDGLEIQLPCAYADLTIYPTQDESWWLPPEESNYADGMYDQMIEFKVNEESNQLYTLWSAYHDDESYQSGTIYSIMQSENGTSLTYCGEDFVCGETTQEELVEKFGTRYTLSATGAYIYTYQDGNIVAVFLDDTLDFIMIRSTVSYE